MATANIVQTKARLGELLDKVEPGEMVIITNRWCISRLPFASASHVKEEDRCRFEIFFRHDQASARLTQISFLAA